MFYRLRRRLTQAINETIYRLGYKDVRQALERLGISAGDVVCVHSALRELGHLADGPAGIVRALQDAVGRSGAVLMPTFSFGGTMLEYVEQGGVFDVRSTPSKVGFLTEYFRKQDGVRRSLHPTHSVSGWGDAAVQYLHGHEHCTTPFGMASPYGRMVEQRNTYMLMLGTRLLSLPHHLQERVDFPNLYLPGSRTLRCIDHEGRDYTVDTQVMRPKVPYFVAIPSAAGNEPEWCVLHDFCLLFPRWREREVLSSGVHLDGCPQILSRRRDLEDADVLRIARLGRGEIGLLNIAGFMRRVQPELEQILARYADHYRLEGLSNRFG